ncbi:hypothetical protein FHR99_003193 [Litorivivens lipolytica]|uniref:Uncharacterized protein n=1 Tax=Litorivivens lipolytica TaxID=1524264 RepID=A0A7W4Z6V6_9GAMM|nr:hypothetical protein [Litorivivens lipolytica]MBB3048919.1 hypothetical protein [Litorivivens lipolytica]
MEGVPPEAITREEKEAIVAEEEAKIKATYRDLSIGALISALTFGSF